ncbi:MAG TPA: energy-coupling factor ABC transporter substrate-binding protein [Eubacteriaceae bacterium]|nr:energy-coupling factor ABC transporter substrate-binding protein [Eubacteriaceae bacterium]
MKKSSIWIMILLIVLLVLLPLYLLPDAEFGGADGEAEEIITEIDPNYSPWFEPIIEPASGEIESLIFALQAAFGAGIIAYYFGYRKGRNSRV